MKIFLIGWFGSGNMGDEAILISELLTLRKQIKEVEFYVLSFDPERTRRLTANIPEVKKILRMGSKHNVIRSDLLGILRAFKEADVVVIGGGGIFQDIYNYYPIPFFTAMALLARFHGKRLMLYCVGLGPINTFTGRKLCRLTANSADIISVRDSESRDLLEDFGVEKEVHLSADPAFILEPIWNEKVENIIKAYDLGSNGLVIGVCVQDLLFWSNRNRRILADTLDTLNRERRAKIVFLPLGSYRDSWFGRSTSETVDVVASKRLGALMKRQFSMITDELSPQELLAVMERMDLVISMRLHGLIAGARMVVPVIGLTYREESKIANLMKRLGQEDSLFVVCNLQRQNFLDRIDYLLFEENRDVKGKLRKSVSCLCAEIEKCNELLCRTLIDDPLA